MTRYETWALVTNGVRARILRELEDGGSEDLLELVSKGRSTNLRAFLSDKVGRSTGSDASERRAAMASGADPILRDMQDFAQETLRVLEDHLHKGHLTRLAIFAAPRMLGILHREMPASLNDAVFLERGLNLIDLPRAELRLTVIRAIEEDPSR